MNKPAMCSWACSAMLVVSLGACTGAEERFPCGEPAYVADASDEVFVALLDAEDNLVVDANRTSTLTVPAGGAIDDAAAAPLLSWQSSLVAVHDVATSRPAHPSFQRRSVSDVQRAWASLTSLIVPSAHAHLPPVTGDVHWVRIHAAGQGTACPMLQGLSTTTDWQLDDDSWATWKAATGAYEVTITSAYVVDNRITEGPFRSSPVVVNIQ
jgi:hypothetical protein